MRAQVLTVLVACFAVLAAESGGSAQDAGTARPAPLFTGKSLPQPPRQGKPWTPAKSNLPAACVSAAEKLVSYGFADPQGCEYRAVELTCGTVWSNVGGVVKTHAWVLPAEMPSSSPQPGETVGANQRFAVTWSGLVYPISAVGEAADLPADIAALLKQPPARIWGAPTEAQTVAHQSVDGLKLCMLQLVGESAAAEKLWDVLRAGEGSKLEPDPYLPLVTQWTWAHYDRAVCAHMRGDDVVALASAQVLASLTATIDKDAAARGLARPRSFRRDREHEPFIPFLGNVGRLQADAERRVKAGPGQRVLELGLDKFPDPQQRIAALIGDLDEVSATQWSQPGGVSLGENPIVGALVQEGEAAVEPLLRCFEKDSRLTRSVSFHRDFFTHRNLLGVDDAAFTALRKILNVRTFGPRTEHGYNSEDHADAKAEFAKEIRAYWGKVNQLSETERCYATLADDNATAQQWLEAAQKIAGPVSRDPTPGGAAGGATVPPIVRSLLPPGDFAGEILRGKQDPSVAELLRKRAEQVSLQEQNSTLRIHRLADACEMTLSLAAWETKSAASEIRRRVAQCLELMADDFYGPYSKQLAPVLSRLSAAGIEAGDRVVAAQYAAWLKGLAPDRVELARPTAPFYALYRFPEDQELAAAGRQLFSKDSPWRPLHGKLPGKFGDLVGSPLVGAAAFREMLKEELRNQEPAARLEVNREKGSYAIRLGGASYGQTVADASDPLLAAVQAPISLRACDLYAWQLARLEGSPPFEPYWPEDRREEAIGKLAEFLDRWGNAFRPGAGVRPAEGFRAAEARFRLSRLDRPATAEEAAQGRAIFSLTAPGGPEVRVVPLAAFPQMARWKSLDKFPLRRAGQSADQIRYDRGGYVWQAEEVLIDGRWQRFYGFVGNHIIAQVPAAEIEFLTKYGEEPLLRW